MNKFTKILVLMFILAVLVTSFTVIAFAAGSEEEEAPEKKSVVLDFCAFEDKEEGSLEYQSNVDGTGYFGVAVAENGNKYIKHYVKDGTGNPGHLARTYMSNKSYSFQEYPYVALDIDVSKLTYDYSGFRINNIAYAYGPVYDDFGNLVTTLNGIAVSTSVIDSSYFKNYLPTEENVWAHVTIVLKYHIYDGAEYIGAYIYVNGEEVYTNDKNMAVSDTYLASNYYFGTFRITSTGAVDTNKMSGLDNWQITFFNDAYTMQEVASYVYNDSYELPYSYTKAMIGYTVYDNLDKAISDAKPGDTITLISDIDGVVSVEKSLKIDTNKYDEDGNPTGEYYNLQTTSTTLVSSSENGILNFKQFQNASVEIYWDDCPGVTAGGECTCDPIYLDEKGNHRMSLFTPSAMLNDVPCFTGELPKFPVVDGFTTSFVGWSYTQGGEAEPLRKVTEEDVNNGWISIYPVYESVQYNIEVISSSGSNFYFAKDLASALKDASKGSTVKLLTDSTVDSSIAVTKSLTFDLNGHRLIFENYFGNHYVATSNGAGGYNYGTNVYKPITAHSDTLFNITSDSVEFKLTSSVGGGEVYVSSAKADSWYYGNELVKRTVGENASSLVLYCGISSAKISIDGGINFYGNSFLYVLGKDNNVDVKNINFYHMKSSLASSGNNDVFMFKPANSAAVNTVTVSNSLFHLDTNNSFIKTYLRSDACELTFVNCDIVKPKEDYATYISLNNGALNVSFDTCRLYDVACTSTNTTVYAKGSLGSSASNVAYGVIVPSGFENKTLENAVQYKYLVPAATAYTTTVNGDIESISFSYPATEELTISYNLVTTTPTPKTVIWMNGDAVVSTQTDFYPGCSSFAAPEIIKDLPDDLYRDLRYQWVDANGVPYTNAKIDWSAATVTFYAAESVNGATEYKPDIDDGSLFNLTYLTQFRQNFYLPVVEGMERPTVTGVEPSQEGIVMIDGRKYYCYTFLKTSTSIFDTDTLNVNYTIEGVDYTAMVDVSGLIYAEIILSNQSDYAAEAESVANMVRYAYECYAIAGADLDPHIAKIAELIGTVNLDGSTTGGMYNLSAYTTDFGQLAESDIDNYSQYIHSMSFGMIGSSIRTMVVLTEEATEAGVTIISGNESLGSGTTTIKNATGVDVTVKFFYTKSLKVYDAINKIDITIEIPNEESKYTSYSLAHYITAMSTCGENINVAKALYDFGASAQAYRENQASCQ